MQHQKYCKHYQCAFMHTEKRKKVHTLKMLVGIFPLKLQPRKRSFHSETELQAATLGFCYLTWYMYMQVMVSRYGQPSVTLGGVPGWISRKTSQKEW